MIYRYDFLAKQWFESSPDEMREYLHKCTPEPPITDDQLKIMVENLGKGMELFNMPDPLGKRSHLYTDGHFRFRWSTVPIIEQFGFR